MLPPPHPPASERSAHHAETDSLRSPNSATRLSAIDLYPITESLKAHNEDSGLGATLGRLIVGMANHIVELPPNARVAPREMMTEAIREESSQRASSRDLVEAEIALVTLGGTENARHVYETARKTAHHAIDKSIAEVSRWDASAGSTYIARKQPFLDILKAVKVRMSEF